MNVEVSPRDGAKTSDVPPLIDQNDVIIPSIDWTRYLEIASIAIAGSNRDEAVVGDCRVFEHQQAVILGYGQRARGTGHCGREFGNVGADINVTDCRKCQPAGLDLDRVIHGNAPASVQRDEPSKARVHSAIEGDVPGGGDL